MKRLRRLSAVALLGALALGGIGYVQARHRSDGEAAPERTKPGGSAVRIGIYESRAIAAAFIHSKFNVEHRKLLETYTKAKAAGDEKLIPGLKERLEKLQDRLHRQGFGKEPVDDLLAAVKDGIPEICRAAGVQAIVSGIVFAEASVERVDVTDPLVRLYDPSEKVLKIVAELKDVRPMEFDEFPIKD